MPKNASTSNDNASSLQSPKALFALLTQCRKDPLRRVACAFAPGVAGKPDIFVVHAKLNGKTLLAEVCADAGLKGGTFGEAWVEADAMKLLLDKPSAGLERKILAVVKQSGYRIERVVLADDAAPAVAAIRVGTTSAVDDARAGYRAHRTKAIEGLMAMARRIAAARHEKSAAAILEIQAVIKHLGVEPSTLHQVEQLQHWLVSDGVIQDVCELWEDIRTPLMQALNSLRFPLASR